MAESLKESFYRATMEGAPPDERARDMILAASNGELWKVRLLHEELQVDVHVFDEEALDVAAEQGHLETVQYLVGKGCNVNKGRSSDGFTPYIEAYPFILALQACRWEVAIWMLQQGANLQANNNQPLLIALEKDNLDFMRVLFETGKLDAIRNTQRVLSQAAETASGETARFLLAHLRRYDQDDLDAALLAATTRDSPEMMLLFLEAGANPNARQGGCLYQAAHNGFADAVRVLVRHGADATFSDFKALRAAVLQDHSAVVRLMLEEGCLHRTPDVFDTLPFAGKYGHPMETPVILREWRPAVNEAQKSALQKMYGEFQALDFPAGPAGTDLAQCNAEGRSLLVALILAGGFEQDVVPRFSGVTADLLLQRDGYGLNAVEALARYGELDKLLVPALWLGRAADLHRLWQGLPEHHRQDMDIEKTISAVHQHELRQMTRRCPRLRPE